MKFLVDNALSHVVAERLRQAGHDSLHVRERGLAAAEDEQLLDLAQREGRVLVTADTDFGTLLALRGDAYPSVVLLRGGATYDPEEQASLLSVTLPVFERELDSGCILVFDEARIRVRLLPIGGDRPDSDDQG